MGAVEWVSWDRWIVRRLIILSLPWYAYGGFMYKCKAM